jgi:hypothetical protein
MSLERESGIKFDDAHSIVGKPHFISSASDMLAINPQGSSLVSSNHPSSLIEELLLVAWLNL